MRRVMRHPALLIGLAYMVLACAYLLAAPMYEAPDESYHFAFAARLAQSWELPVQDPAVITPWFQEGSQPPLYYYLASLVIRLSGAPAEPYLLPENPHAAIGLGLATINNNFYLRGPAEAFPWRGSVLAFYLVRIMSIGLGAWTLLALYRGVRLAVPGRPRVALVALGITAFNPMFLFMTASVNNDNLVTALAASGLWLMLLILTRGLAGRDGALRVLALAIVLALAALSKLSGLTLYVVAGALLTILILKRRAGLRAALLAGAALVIGFAVIAGWWYVRNWQLYGDLTGTSAMIAIIQPRPAPYTLWTMLAEMEGLRISFWALFGWFNVIGPAWFLSLMDALTALALIGGAAWGIRAWRARQFEALLPIGLLALHVLITFAALISWTRQTPGTQGRLLFPALVGISGLMALGWWSAAQSLAALIGRARERLREIAWLAPTASVGIIAVVAALIPFMTIAPAYAPPPVVSALPTDAIPVGVRFDGITLLGYQIEPDPVAPGGQVPITLYYRGDPDPRNLSLYLTLLDGDDRSIGGLDTYPGGGNLPTSQFALEAIYADTYHIPVDPDTHGPLQVRVACGWWDYATGERLIPYTADGTALESLILRGGALIDPSPPPVPEIPVGAIFSGALRLNGYTLHQSGDRLEVRLIWEALARVYEDFNVMLHLTAEDGTIVAQGDGPPLAGVYPTSAWAPHLPFADGHDMALRDVPSGTYRLLVGLYRLTDQSRLPVALDGAAVGDALLLDTPITVR
jgi:hypothetical protein